VPSLASKPLKILHLGTGAGLLPMFLNNQLEIEKLTTVDISKEMIQVAE
jgi:tRNA1(Val) A37 N6-methylase TrmN6